MRQNISSGGVQESVIGYSRAVRIGNHIYVSGTTAPAGNEDKTAYEQTKIALSIIEKALLEAGSGFSDVVRTVVYVTDMTLVDQYSKAHFESFGKILPACTMVEVNRFFRPWQLVEIEAYAVLMP